MSSLRPNEISLNTAECLAQNRIAAFNPLGGTIADNGGQRGVGAIVVRFPSFDIFRLFGSDEALDLQIVQTQFHFFGHSILL
jgi:hypothetical protein